MKNTIKKMLMAATGFCLCTALFLLVPQKTYAYPCTIDLINEAKAQKSAAEAELLAAQNNKIAADAAVTAAKASGASQLVLQQAYDNASNAANLVRAAVDKVNNAQAFIENAQERLAAEDEYEANVVKWNNQVTIANAKEAATTAKEIADTAASLITIVRQNIASLTSQLAVSPSLQTQIDQLNASLPSLEADYAANLADANEKAAIADYLEKTLVH